MVAACVELMWIGEVAPAITVAGLEAGLEHGTGVQVCELEAERAHWRGRGWWSEGGLYPRAHLLVRVVDLPQYKCVSVLLVSNECINNLHIRPKGAS